MSNDKAQMSNQIQSSNPHDWLVTTNDENIGLTTPTPPLPPPRGRERVGGSCICVLNVKIFGNLVFDIQLAFACLPRAGIF